MSDLSELKVKQILKQAESMSLQDLDDILAGIGCIKSRLLAEGRDAVAWRLKRDVAALQLKGYDFIDHVHQQIKFGERGSWDLNQLNKIASLVKDGVINLRDARSLPREELLAYIEIA